jgi:hypothetical protein
MMILSITLLADISQWIHPDDVNIRFQNPSTGSAAKVRVFCTESLYVGVRLVITWLDIQVICRPGMALNTYHYDEYYVII